MWYDDPIFDGAEEVFSGMLVQGDEWRRVQRIKEDGCRRIVKVAGTTFRRSEVEAAVNESKVAVIREMNNPHDANALRVELGGLHVGYIPRSSQSLVSPDSTLRLFKVGVDPQPYVWICVS